MGTDPDGLLWRDDAVFKNLLERLDELGHLGAVGRAGPREVQQYLRLGAVNPAVLENELLELLYRFLYIAHGGNTFRFGCRGRRSGQVEYVGESGEVEHLPHDRLDVDQLQLAAI